MAAIHVVSQVRAYFVAQGVACDVSFGWKAAVRQLGGANRVVFVPTAPKPIPPTQLGDVPVTHEELLPAGRQRVARALYDLRCGYRVRIWGYDPVAPGDDEHQMAKCIDLLEKVSQGLQTAYCGNVAWGDGEWTTKGVDVRQGAELVMALTVTMPIFDRSRVVLAPTPLPREPKPVPYPTP